MARIGLDPVDAPAFAAGRRTQVALRRQSLLAGLLLVVSGKWKVTGGTGAGQMHPSPGWLLARQIQVIVDGAPLQVITGLALRAIHRFFGTLPVHTPPAGLAPGTNAAFEATFPVVFQMPWSRTPEAFALPTYAVGSPTLIVDWAEAGELASGMDGAASLEDVNTSMYELRYEGLPLHPATQYGGLSVTYYEVPVVQTEDAKKVYLDQALAGEELRAVIIEAESGGTAGAHYRPSDAVVTHARLVIGGRPEIERTPWGVLQVKNAATYGLSARETGAVILDSADDMATGRGQMWTIPPGDRPYVELGVSAAPPGDKRVRVTTIAARRHPSGR